MLLATGALIGWVITLTWNAPGNEALAGGGKVKSPVGTAPDRYVYYPGTEELGSNEIRLIACGTGMPAARLGQAATCWLVEVGNGDKFLFDIGTGSMANAAALMIPYDFLDKVFLSHLHTDHWGDLDALWAGGVDGGPNAVPQGVGSQRRAAGDGHQGGARGIQENLLLGLGDPRGEAERNPWRDRNPRV